MGKPGSEKSAETMLLTMARMQDGYNRQVHEDWRTQGYEYYRAIWVECAELLDHYGWKWWKHQRPDLDQVKLEIVDIWHFGLSELIRSGHIDPAASALDGFDGSSLFVAGRATGHDARLFREVIERLAGICATRQTFDLDAFVEVLNALPLGYQELFNLYVGKNVLNRFRQDHGYRSGEYRKLWQGREDNEHLMELLPEIDGTPEELPELLYARLEDRYLDASNVS